MGCIRFKEAGRDRAGKAKFLDVRSKASWQNSLNKHGSCVKSKNQWVENVWRTTCRDRVSKAKILIFVQHVLLTKFSEKRRNYISYGSCGEKHWSWVVHYCGSLGS